MKRDQVFLISSARASDFVFNTEVAQVFDDMIVRSVPFYLEQQFMIKEIGKKFWIPNTNVYDLGCSTATTLINLCREIDGPGQFIGYDNSTPMLEQAKRKIKENGLENRIELRYGDLNEDLSNLAIENASVITMCFTLQFIRPLKRDNLIKKIYNSLVEDSVLVVTEKILTNTTHMNRFFIDFYYDFKKRNGYTENEIMRKRESLENVLIPYRIDENIDLFRRNGFEIVETFFQWYNFAGFLCVKKPI
jgi:tRNA (cmo5U34)-methyltransferase